MIKSANQHKRNHPKLVLAGLFFISLSFAQTTQQFAISTQQQQWHLQSTMAGAEQQQLQHQNDLLKSMVLEASGNFDKQPQQGNNHYGDNDRIMAKRQRSLVDSNGRPVINGNHATYVEPPANFKPIIYEPERQISGATLEPHESLDSLAQQQQAKFIATSSSGANQLSSSFKHTPTATDQAVDKQSNGFVSSIGSAAVAQDQSISSDLDNESSSSSNNNNNNAEEDANRDNANVLPLKPSIGRWSDWHDMSVEPDLASSETQLTPQAFGYPPSAITYKTRYSWPSNDAKLIRSPYNANQQRRLSSYVPSAAARAPLQVSATLKEQPTYATHKQHQQVNLIRMRTSPGVEYVVPQSYHLMPAHHHHYHHPYPQHHYQQRQNSGQAPFYLVSSAPLLLPPPSPMHILLAHQQQQRSTEALRRSSHFEAPPAAAYRVSRYSSPPLKSDYLKLQRVNTEVRVPAKQVSAPLMSAVGQQQQARVFLLSKAPIVGPTNSKANATVNSKSRISDMKKKRPIRTQLPVGLSSWMLGGIRDLNARHWHLPADVVDKLNVNDVDLIHTSDHQAPNLSSDQDSMTNIQKAPTSELEQAGPALRKQASTQRPPAVSNGIASNVIPR